MTRSMTEEQTKQRRGFAAMPRELLLELSSRGGKAAHDGGAGHKFTAHERKRGGRTRGAQKRRAKAEAKDA